MEAPVGSGCGGRGATPDEAYAYNLSQFAAREEQMRLVSDKLKLARRGEPDHRLLVEFFGVPGVGKSWLLACLRERYALKPPGRTVSALVTLERVSQDTDWYALLRTVAWQIKAQVPAVGITAFEPKEAAEERRSELSAELVKLVKELPGSHIPLLLFDATEKSSELLGWLEDDIIYPLLHSNRVVVVFAGRRWLRWKRFEVRRRVQALSLEPFGESDSTAAMLEKLGVDRRLAGTFFAYAFGHPLTTRVIVSALEEAGIAASEIDAASIERNESLIAEKVYERVIRDRFLKALPRGRERERLECLVEIACIPRRFDVAPLQAFAQKFDGELFPNEAGEYYSEAISVMRSANLVQRTSKQRGLGLLPVLRWIVSKNLSMRDERTFVAWHGAARDQYSAWIKDIPVNGVNYLIEWAYHQAWVLWSQGRPEAEVARQVGREFKARWDELSQVPDFQWDLVSMVELMRDRLVDDLEFQRFFPEVHARVSEEARKSSAALFEQVQPAPNYAV